MSKKCCENCSQYKSYYEYTEVIVLETGQPVTVRDTKKKCRYSTLVVLNPKEEYCDYHIFGKDTEDET
jgi:hypothetical protein